MKKMLPANNASYRQDVLKLLRKYVELILSSPPIALTAFTSPLGKGRDETQGQVQTEYGFSAWERTPCSHMRPAWTNTAEF